MGTRPFDLRLPGALLTVALLLLGCRALGIGRPPAKVEKLWNLRGAHSLVFPLQTEEREFSALVSDGQALYLVSERAGKLLRIEYPIEPTSIYQDLDLWKRPEAEYEAAALQAESLYLLDEAFDGERGLWPLLVEVRLSRPSQKLSALPIRWKALDCQDGLCLEGLALDGDTVYLLDERDRRADGQCAGKLYVTSLSALRAANPGPMKTVELELPDCSWRYTDLAVLLLEERRLLLALRTRCLKKPGSQSCDEEAYVVELLEPWAEKPVISRAELPSYLTEWWKKAPVSRNLEGLAAGPDGALYLVSDNRWQGGQMLKTLLLRIPRR